MQRQSSQQKNENKCSQFGKIFFRVKNDFVPQQQFNKRKNNQNDGQTLI